MQYPHPECFPITVYSLHSSRMEGCFSRGKSTGKFRSPVGNRRFYGYLFPIQTGRAKPQHCQTQEACDFLAEPVPGRRCLWRRQLHMPGVLNPQGMPCLTSLLISTTAMPSSFRVYNRTSYNPCGQVIKHGHAQ